MPPRVEGVVQHLHFQVFIYLLNQGCQTRFGSGASSGKFNLKPAGPT